MMSFSFFPHRGAFRSLFLAMICTLPVLFIGLPLWAQASTLLLFIWRWFYELHYVPLPSRWFTSLCAIGILAITRFEYGSFFGAEASTCILVVVAGLKTLEIRKPRDISFLILLGFAQVALCFLVTLDLWVAVPTSLGTFFLWKAMMEREPFLQISGSQKFSFIGKIFVLSLPLTLLLFAFFPRFKSPFATMKSPYGMAGFSDELEPGSVSALVSSREPAFRAEFETEDAQNSVGQIWNMYWTGDILTDTADGLSWRHATLAFAEKQNRTLPLRRLPYLVTLEPHGRTWIFVLDPTTEIQATDFSSGISFYQKAPSVFRATNAVTSPLSYRASYVPGLSYRVENEQPFLQLPKISDKVKALAAQLKKKNRQASVIEAMSYLHKEGFHYSLVAASRGINLEKFLFETKIGFCEHYAGSFATLLRAMGIPSRVVLGYQGGKYNQFGNFWSVTQNDAHAWVEYANDNGTWIRVDPTEAVAPLRISLGAEEFFNLPDDLRDLKEISSYQRPNQTLVRLWLDQFSSYLDNLNYKWNQFLLDFNQNGQKEILRNFLAGLKDSGLFGGAYLSTLFAVFLMFVGIRFLRRKKASLNPAQKIYSDLLTWSHLQGIEKSPSEGPQDFFTRLLTAFPHLKRELELVRSAYLRYQFYEISEPESLSLAFRSLKTIRRSRNP